MNCHQYPPPLPPSVTDFIYFEKVNYNFDKEKITVWSFPIWFWQNSNARAKIRQIFRILKISIPWRNRQRHSAATPGLRQPCTLWIGRLVYLAILYIFFPQFYRFAKFSNLSVDKSQQFGINWLTKTQFETLKQRHSSIIRIHLYA
jgi:hypothetical protein